MKLFEDDELDCEVKNEMTVIPPQYYEHLKPLYGLMEEAKDAYGMLPIYPLDAIHEFLKYLVFYKDVSGVKARLFWEKYSDIGGGCPIYRILERWGDEKYFQMLDELTTLANS